MPEVITVIACFDDVAVVGKSIQQGYRHLFFGKHITPFREAQVGGNDDTGLFIEFADQVQEKKVTGLTEQQITQLIQDD